MLKARPEARLEFLLPTGDPIPPHFHLTEVGHVVRHFIDCGGALHDKETCVLQFWTSEEDREHRLTAGKFAGILALGERVLPGQDLEVEVEWDCCVTAQYPIAAARLLDDRIVFQLTATHTDCLARKRCGIGKGTPDGGGKDERAVAATCC